MTFPALGIQKAVYAALTGDATLTALITGVHDQVPQTRAFPYVTIGDDTYAEFASHTFDGVEGTLQVHTWTQSGGRASAHAIQQNIYRLLHENYFSIAGVSAIVMRWEFSEILVDPDTVTYHGIQRFKIILGGT